MTTAAEARDKPRLELVRLVEVALLNSGPTLYISDRNIVVGGQRYESYLEDLSGLGEELRRADSSGLNSDLTLRFRNDAFKSYNYLVEIGETYPFEGATVTVKEVYLDDDGTPSDVATVFKGVLEEPRDIDLLGFSCKVSSMEYAKDISWKQAVINSDDWPDAIEDLGEVEPIIYGDDVRVPALRVKWGARTTLQGGIGAADTSLTVSDGSRFPASSFVIWMDAEQILVGTRTGNSFTSLTRGYNGTTATGHQAGTEVLESLSQYDSLLAAQELHTVGDIFAEIERRLVRVTSGVTGVYTGGKHLLRATEAISIQPINGDVQVDNYFTPSVRRISRRATNLPMQEAGWASGVYSAGTLTFPSAPAGMTLTNVKLRLYIYISSFTAPDAEVNFYVGSGTGGTKICSINTSNILSYYVELPLEVSKSGWVTSQVFTKSGGYCPDTYFTIYDAVIEADVTSTFSGDVDGGVVQKPGSNLPLQSSNSITVNFPSAPSGTLKNVYSEYEWSVIVLGNPLSTVKLKIDSLEVCWVTTSGIVVPFCDYRIQRSQTGWATSKQFTVTNSDVDVIFTIKRASQYAISSNEDSVSYAVANGGVVATRFVERFHATVKGYKDPDGNYGGIGNLVERPDYVIKHFLVQVLGFSLSDIDSTSFGAAGTSYGTEGYKLAFRIDRKIKPSEWLKRMARECRSVLRYRAGKWYLDYIPDSAPSAVRTITKDELAGEGAEFSFSKTSRRDVANDLTALFKRNYSRLGSDSEWDGTASASDATSQAKYGTYSKEVDFECVRLQAMADDVLAHMLMERKASRLAVEFPVWWEHFDLAVGDTIDIDNPLYDGRKFFIEEIRRFDGFRAEVRAVEWW